MHKYYLNLLFILFGLTCAELSFSQSELVNIQFKTPSISSDQKTAKVYLPPNYEEGNNDQYGLIIFLHGSGNSSSSGMAEPTQEAMDEMIQRRIDFPAAINPTDFKVRPMIIVFPHLKANFTDKPTFSSAHQYENSEYFGNFEDVIVKDLIESLKNEENFNLKNKIDFKRESMAIAGFSSGGDGALRIGLKHRDKFIAIGAHAAYSSLRPKKAWEPILEQYRAGTQLFVDEISGLSAVWIGLKENKEPDLLVNSSGTILQEKLDVMRMNAGIIQNYFNLDEEERSTHGYLNLADSQDSNLPYIYADCGGLDIWLKEFNEDFINYMNVVYPDYFRGNIVNDVNHQLSTVNVKRSLDFIDSKMASTTPVYDAIYKNNNIEVIPNPVSEFVDVNVSFDLNLDLTIQLINIDGTIYRIPNQSWSLNKNTIHIELDKFPTGQYTLLISNREYRLTEKIVIIK